MKIRNIFEKDIFRAINGVVKAEQKNDAVVWQELDEYVVTKEIYAHFDKFYKAYIDCIVNPKNTAITDNMGVWVSGFFGSGKSHFIKILSYLLGNIEAHNPVSGEAKNAVAFFENKITDAKFFADIKRVARNKTDVILFNIDSKANHDDGKMAILKVFWRVFNDMQGFSRDSIELAEIERHLHRDGKYETFCKKIKDIIGSDWHEIRDSYALNEDEIIQALSKSLNKSIEASGKWFNDKINNSTINIETFAERVKEYLDNKGAGHRMVFLVDEMGQFVGDETSLMLNLQTITENLGMKCEGRAWVVVTSQEAIDFVIGNLKGKKENDFSKIRARFKTNISLSSTKTDEVIQIRLLEKNTAAKPDLENLFKKKGDIIKNQMSFTSDSVTFNTYTDSASFIKSYPFVPYQFQIIQKVFESIRKTGFAGKHLSQGERSMLDAFQLSAQALSDNDLGSLAPLYSFYPCIESFLDTLIKKGLDQAGDNSYLKPFDISLLQTL